MNNKNTHKNALLPTSEIIARAKTRGVDFGKGDPNNRIRYYTKINLLPHALRKETAQARKSRQTVNAATLPPRTEGHYPAWVIDKLVTIDKKLKRGKTIQQIVREDAAKTHSKPTTVAKEKLQEALVNMQAPTKALEPVQTPAPQAPFRTPSDLTADPIPASNAVVNEQAVALDITGSLIVPDTYESTQPAAPKPLESVTATSPSKGFGHSALSDPQNKPIFSSWPQGVPHFPATVKRNSLYSGKSFAYQSAFFSIIGIVLLGFGLLANTTLLHDPLGINDQVAGIFGKASKPEPTTMKAKDPILTFIPGGEGTVLAERTPNLDIVTINADTEIIGKLTAPNIIYSLIAGNNIQITEGQTPTISATFTEADTLATVTGRGATTATALSLTGGLTTTTLAASGITNSGTTALTGAVTLSNTLNLGSLSSEPSTGANGMTYYNSSTNKFRCYQNSTWKDCDTDTTGGSMSSFTVAGTSGSSQTVSDGQTLTIAAGNGITTTIGGTRTLTTGLDVTVSGAVSGETSTASGLAVNSDGLGLLRGCSNNQALIWNSSSAIWQCGAPSGLVIVKEGSTTVSNASTLEFKAGDFDLSENPSGTALIQLTGVPTSLTGAAGNFDVAGTLIAGTSDAFQVSTAGGITIPSTQTLTVGSIKLTDASVASDSLAGASLIGVRTSGFSNSTASSLQTVLRNLDSAIGSGASKWTQQTGFIYLTNTTDGVVIGGSTTAAGKLYFDTTNSILNLGTNESANGTLRLYSSGVGITDPTIAADASGNIIATSTNFTTTSTGINNTAIGATTRSTGAFTTLSSTLGTTLASSSGNTAIGNSSGTIQLIGSNVNLSTVGVLTLAGAQTQDINSAVSSGTGAALVFQPGTSTGASTNGAAFTIKGGDGSGTTSVTGGALTLQGGSATGAAGTRTGGNLVLEPGTGATANGSINIGSTNAGSINIGAAATAKTIAIGSTAGDTINIGTGATTAKTISIGTGAVANTIAIGSSSATTVSITDDNWNVTAAGAGTFVGVNATTGLLQGTGGITVTGTGNINATGTSATNIGNATGALTLASGGTSAWTNTSGNLTISTATSGTLAVTSAGALNFTGAAASTWDIGANTLSLQTTNNGAITTGTGLLTQGGNVTFSGTSARTITGPSTGGLTVNTTSGPLTLSTTTSGTLAVSSAGAVNITGAANSTWGFGSNNILITSGNLNTTAAGINSTAIGATTRSTGAFTTLGTNNTVTLANTAAGAGSQLCIDGSSVVVTCSAGSGISGSGTQNQIPKFNNAAGTSIGDSSLSDSAATLSFTKEVAKTIQIADSTTANTVGAALTIKGAAGAATNAAGGAVNVTGGAGAGNQAGGALVLTGGAGGTTGAGGAIQLVSGASGATSGTAGNISLDVGASTTSNGSILIGTAARAQTITIGNTTGGVLTLGQNGAAVVVDGTNFDVSSAGVLTLAGGQTADLTTATASTATAITIQPGISSAATGTGASLTLQAGNESGTTTATGGTLSLQGGNATGAAGTRTGGAVTIDSGSGVSAGGAITIAGTNAASLALARSGITTTINGSTTLAPSTANALQINPFGASAGNTGETRFMELTANGTNYTGFKAPDSLTANLIYTLPTADGLTNYVLTTNGSGALSWQVASGVGGGGGTVTSITAANGLGTAASIQGGSITTSGSLYIVTSPAATAATPTISSGSGLEFDTSNRLTLLRGCTNNQLLTWDSAAGTWKCNTASGVGAISGAGATGQITYWNGSSSITGNTNFTFSAAPTTGDSFVLSNTSFAPAAAATGNLAKLTFTNGSTNTTGTSTTAGLNLAATNNAAGAGGTMETYGIKIADITGTSGAGTQNNYGIRIGNQGLASTENAYGLYVDSQSGSTNSYAAIFAGGNVGIGMTTPDEKLEVNGAIHLDRITAPATTTDKLYNVAGNLTWAGTTVCVSGGPCSVAGTVSVSGTPAADQIAIWTSASAIKGNANYTIDGSLGTYAVTHTSTTATGTGYAFTDTSLTTGKGFSITTSSNPGAAGTHSANLLDVTTTNSTTADTFNGLLYKFTNNPGIAGNTENALQIQNQVTANTTDNAVASLLLLDNADTSVAGSTVVTDALRITNSGGIAAGITNGINFASTTIDSGINFSQTPTTNYLTATNWSVTAAGAETLASNLAVNGGSITTTQTTGNLYNTTATTLNLGGAATAINIGSSAGSTVTFAQAGIIKSTSTSALTLDSGTTGTVNLGTGNNAKTINIGTGTAGNTINIGTDNTTADTIAIGSALDTTTLLGTVNINTSGSAATNIGTSTATGTITIGRTTGTDLALNDAQWNISGTGAANFASVGATTRGTAAFTTLDANSTVTFSGLAASSGSQVCLTGTNTLATCTTGSGGVTGSGTQNQIPKFNNAAGTSIGDSSLSDSAAILSFTKEVAKTIQIADSTTANTAGAALTIKGAAGAATNAAGGAVTLQGSAGVGTGAAGAINLTGGTGGLGTGAVTSGAGSAISLTGGTGGAASGATGTAGNGGSITIDAGAAGAAGLGTAGSNGSITVGGSNAASIALGRSGITTTVTGGLTQNTGTANINATGTSATNIGNSTGALTLASGGTSAWTNTSGNLTIATATSGTLALTSAGALNFTGAAASTWDIGANTLSLQTTNNGAITTGTGLLTVGGNVTFSGTSARTITAPNTGASGALTVTTTGNLSGLSLTTATGASGNSGAIAIVSGGTSTSGTSGNVTIDVGAGATSNGSILIGNASRAQTITIGNTTGGVLTLGQNGAAVVVDGTNFDVSSAGVVSLLGGQTRDITTQDSATSVTAITIQPGILSAATGTGAALTLQAGNESGTTTATGGTLTLQGGNATGASGTRTGGAVTIDSGSGATAGGAITIAGTNAASLALGRSAITTTINGTINAAGLTASKAVFTDASKNLTSTGTVAVDQGGTGVTTFGGTNTILYTTAADTLSSITTGNTGALVTSSTGAPSITTGTANQVLRVNGAGTTVGFGSIDLSTSAAVGTSVLAVGNGGTGLSSGPTANGQLLIGASSGSWAKQVLNAAGGSADSGITITNGANTIDIALGSLTTNWTQSGAFNIILDNASSRLKMKSGDGAAFYGTLDLQAISADKTYRLPSYTGSTADICLTTGNCSGVGGSISGTGTSPQVAFFTSASNVSSDSSLNIDGTNHRVGVGTASPATLFNVFGASEVALFDPATVTADGGLNNSPTIRLRGKYDSDPLGTVSSANESFDLRTTVTTGGVSPVSNFTLANVNNASSSTTLLNVTNSGAYTLTSVQPSSVSTATGTNAPTILTLSAATGGTTSNASGTGGVGSGVSLTLGTGGTASGTTASTGGAGGVFSLTGGAGGAATTTGANTAGAGGAITLTGGAAGSASGGTSNTGAVGGAVSLVGGAGNLALSGGAVNFTGGQGGATGVGGAINLTSGAGGATSGNSGAIILLTGTPTAGTAGNISLDVGTSTSGNGSILIGTAARAQTITVGNSTGATSLGFTSGSASQTHTSSVATGTTTSAAFVFTDSALTSGTGLYLTSSSIQNGKLLDVNTGSANTLTSGTLANIASSSTAGTGSGSSFLLDLSRSGANSNASHTAYGLRSQVTNTGTTSTNIGAYLSASGATNNYALIVPGSGGNVGIGTTTPAANILLDLTSTTQAFAPPRMTTTQRDAITSPTAGMLIYNTTSNATNFYDGTQWTTGSGTIPSGTAGQIAFYNTATTITSEASGFGWDTTNKLFTITGATGSTTQTTETITSAAQGLTSGGLFSAALTSSAATASFTGNIGSLSSSRTNSTASQTLTDSGSLLNLSRTTITNNGTATTNVTGPLVNISNIATPTLGTLADSADLIKVTQDADATGALLHLITNRSSTNTSLLIEQTSGGVATMSLTDAGVLSLRGGQTIDLTSSVAGNGLTIQPQALTTASGTGGALTVKAGNETGTTSTGGSVSIDAGTGTSTNGSVTVAGTNAASLALGRSAITTTITGTLTNTLTTTAKATFASSTANSDTIQIQPQSGTATASFNGIITSADLTTADKTWTFPNATGTICISGDACATSGTVGYWSRTGTTLSPSTANDVVSISTNAAGASSLALTSSAITTSGTAGFSNTVTVGSTGGTFYGQKLALTNAPVTTANTVYGQYISFTDAGTLANTLTGLYVDATTANTADTTYAAVFQGGNVGIGTATPTSTLYLKASGTARSQLRIEANGGTGAIAAFEANEVLNALGMGTVTNHPLFFTINGDPKVWIDTTGYMGIGVQTPAAQLDILAAATTTGLKLTGTAPVSVATNGTNAATNTLLVVGTAGGASSGITGQTGGTGGALSLTGGVGGAVAGASGIGGLGGGITIAGGAGGNGAATGGVGGAISITAGAAGTGGTANGGSLTLNSGAVTGGGISTINIGTTNTTAMSIGSSALTSAIAITSGATTASAVSLTANSLTAGTALALTSTSTAGGASGNSFLLDLSRSGANANTAHTTYGIRSQVTNTNATSGTNIAGYFSASGATTANYGLLVANGNVGIGTTTPAANILLDLTSTTQAFAPPRMTTTQRDAITSPTAGLFVYNTTTQALNFYNGTAWGPVASGTSTKLSDILAATATNTIDSLNFAQTWQWSTLTSQTAFNWTGGTAMTTGSIFALGSGTYNHGASETGSLASLSFSDATTLNAAATTTTNGLNIASTINVVGGASSSGTKTINALNIASPTLTACSGGTNACAWNGLQITAPTTTANITSTALKIVADSLTTDTAVSLSTNGLTTGTALTLTGGTALTTGGLLNLTGASYAPAAGAQGNLVSLSLTDAASNTTGNSIVTGVNIASTVNTSGVTGTKEINPINIAAPTITACTGGNCTWSGIEINTLTTGALATLTSNGLLVTATGIGAGTLNSVNISNITAGAGTERAITVGSGWDTDLNFVDTSPVVAMGNTGTLTFTDGTNSLLALTDNTNAPLLTFYNAGQAGNTTLESLANGTGNYLRLTASANDSNTAAFFEVRDCCNTIFSVSPSSYFRETLNIDGTSTATDNVLQVSGNALTTGNGISVASTATSFSSGKLLNLSKTGASGSTAFTGDIANITYSQTFNGGVGLTHSGNVLDMSRAVTLTAAQTHTLSGALLTISDANVVNNASGTLTYSADTVAISRNCTRTAGTCTDSGDVMELTLSDASATGSVLVLTDSATHASGGNSLLVTSNATTTGTGINLSATGLTTGTALKITNGTALTTGGALNLTGASYNHGSTNETGSLINIAVTDATNGTATSTTNGINIASTMNVTTGASGTKTDNAINVAAPTLTACTGGSTCIWNGALINTQSTGAAAVITQNGINITAAGVGAGTLTGINISAITAGAGTETAISVGDGWDTALALTGTPSASSTLSLLRLGSALSSSGNASGTYLGLNAATAYAGDFLNFQQNGGNIFRFISAASAVNGLSVTAAATGSGPTLAAIGSDTNVSMTIQGKGSGAVNIGGTTGDINLLPGADNLIANLASTGDFLIQDNGTTFATFADNGTFTLAPSIVASATAPVGLTFTGPAHTALTLSTEAPDVKFNLGRTVQFATGALTNQRAFQILAPTYSFVGASTITNAATVYIDAAPTAFTNATITNSYALWVDSGAVRMDGLVSVGLGSTASTTAVCSSLAGATAPTAGTAYELRDCSGAPAADYMEMYAVEPNVGVGELVAPGSEYVTTKDGERLAKLTKSSGAYQPSVIGIISDPAKAGDFNSIGYNITDQDNPKPVALNGRVAVKVSLENGPINPGDYLTSSSTPGVAMKASRSGPTIGKALEAYSGGSSGKIMVFVNISWVDLDILQPALANASLNPSQFIGNLAGVYTPLTTSTAGPSLATLASYRQEQIAVGASANTKVYDRLIAPVEVLTGQLTADAILTTKIKSLPNEALTVVLDENGSFKIVNKNNLTAFELDENGNATFSGTLVARTIKAESIEGLQILSDRIASLEASQSATSSATLAFGFDKDNQEATISGGIAGITTNSATGLPEKIWQITKVGDAIFKNLQAAGNFIADTFTARQGKIQESLEVGNGLKVLGGTAQLPKTTIGGSLTVGTVTIDDMLSSIDSLSGDLNLQALSGGGVNFISGKVVIDPKGNVTIAKGDLEVTEGVIIGNNQIRGIASPVPVNNTTITVQFPQTRASNLYAVTVTPKWLTSVAVTNKTSSGFTVTFSIPAPPSATFDWIIVD